MSHEGKACFRCQAVKPLDEFYVHRMMGDGRLGKCKECTRTDVQRHRAANPEKFREYEKSRTRALAPHRRMPPEVQRAGNKIRSAIAKGIVTRPLRCEECQRGGVQIQAAHHDYSRPLDVRWLCRSCHSKWDMAEPKSHRLRPGASP